MIEKGSRVRDTQCGGRMNQEGYHVEPRICVAAATMALSITTDLSFSTPSGSEDYRLCN